MTSKCSISHNSKKFEINLSFYSYGMCLMLFKIKYIVRTFRKQLVMRIKINIYDFRFQLLNPLHKKLIMYCIVYSINVEFVFNVKVNLFFSKILKTTIYKSLQISDYFCNFDILISTLRIYFNITFIYLAI